MRRSAASAFLVCCVAAVLVGCSRDAISGPPELRLGRDECGECGMLVSEDRCSSAILVERSGRREYIMFDDIGCMLDYEYQPRLEFKLIDGFVRDYPSRAWVRAEDATFLYADPENLLTPMGTGIVGFAKRTGAEEKQREVGGDIMSYEDLAVARRAWMEARYGPAR